MAELAIYPYERALVAGSLFNYHTGIKKWDIVEVKPDGSNYSPAELAEQWIRLIRWPAMPLADAQALWPPLAEEWELGPLGRRRNWATYRQYSRVFLDWGREEVKSWMPGAFEHLMLPRRQPFFDIYAPWNEATKSLITERPPVQIIGETPIA